MRPLKYVAGALLGAGLLVSGVTALPSHHRSRTVDASMGSISFQDPQDVRDFPQRASRSAPLTVPSTTSTTRPPTPTTQRPLQATPKPKPAVPAPPVIVSSSGGLPAGLICIRNHESGGNYAENTGNGYYGAYQYSNSTWNRYGGYARADLAPPSVQDQRALADYQNPTSRHQHWPNTSRMCGV